LARLTVRLTPRGGADRIDGWDEDAAGRRFLKARVRAAPEDGAANVALEVVIARALGRPKSAVRVVAGAGSRIKTLEIDGLTDAEALARLPG